MSLRSFLAALVACGFLGLPLAHAQDARQAVEAANAQWNEAFGKKDAAALTALYTQDAKLLPPGGRVISGTAEIQKFWQSTVKSGVTGYSIKVIDAQAEGNLAYEVAQWEAKGPGQQTFRGGLVHVFERQGDGSLKSRLHTWSIATP
jgi:uncharacterized protein (TIGR02246 family)